MASLSDLTLDEAGNGYTLQASSDGLAGATTNPSVSLPRRRLAWSSSPSRRRAVTAGQAFGLTLDVEDRFGNRATGFEGNVTAALTGSSAGGSLGGTLTVTAVGGVAAFAGLTVNRAGGGDSLQATAGGLSAVTTHAFLVNPAPAVRLVVTAQPPATITAGSGFGLVVVAVDPFGNVDTSFNDGVTVGLTNQAIGGLGGTVTATASDGVTTFSGLTMTRAGMLICTPCGK